MTDTIDLRLLGEQIKRMQGDIRILKSDFAQIRAGHAKTDAGLAALDAKVTRLDGNLDAFRESVSDRFDQQTELLKSSFRTLSSEIQSLKKS